VREGFCQAAREFPERIRVVDASGSVAEVHAQIVREVVAIL
jgi:thymidylate kinase